MQCSNKNVFEAAHYVQRSTAIIYSINANVKILKQKVIMICIFM